MPADDSVDLASTPAASLSAVNTEPIERLATEYVDRLRKGERPTIASYQAQHPTLASSIGELFPTIAALEGLREEKSDGDAFGQPVLGEFRILRELGRGGMGVVYLAEQPSLARRVALKVLPSSFARDAASRTRFQREARVVAGLSHPNITPVFAVGEGAGQPWFAMQLLHGVGLDQVISTLTAGAAVTSGNGGFAALVRRMRDGVPVLKAREDWQDAAWLQRHTARLIAAAADALHYAHQRGVLHRDVKPANLILDIDGRIWVNDFGLAKGAGDVDVTSAASITGTLLYLAPERFDGITDRRCDVYGLGLVLRELLIKRGAFPTDSRARLIKAIAIDGVPPVRFHAPNLPTGLAAIVDRACAKDPQRRYGDAATFAKELLAFADSVPSVPGTAAAVTPTRGPVAPAETVSLGHWMLLIALGAFLWWVWSIRTGDPPPRDPPPPVTRQAPPPGGGAEPLQVQPAPFSDTAVVTPPPPPADQPRPVPELLPTLPNSSLTTPDYRFGDQPSVAAPPRLLPPPPSDGVMPAIPLPRSAPETQRLPAESGPPPFRPRPPRPEDRPPRPEDGRPPNGRPGEPRPEDRPPRPGEPPPPGPGGRPPPPPR